MKTMFQYIMEKSDKIDINHKGITWIQLLLGYALEPLKQIET